MSESARRAGEPLAGALASFGLDVGRYSPAIVQMFLEQWGEPDLEVDPELRSALVGAFSIGETTFMRHPEQFQALASLLPQLVVGAQGRPLRALSAGCASGEEAYSLAATLSALGSGGYEVEGWDFNPGSVERAREAVYRPWSLRDVDPASVQHWLEPAPCGVRVRADLRKAVRFQVANLYADPLPSGLDIVFCRNVLLYFRRDAAPRVLRALCESLRIGGVLFLGHYDPLPPGDLPLEERRIGSARYFVRTECIPEPPRQDVVRRVSPSAAALISHERTFSSLPNGLEHVRRLSDSGRSEAALEILARLRVHHPLATELHVLTALVAEEAGRCELMLEAARRACCVEPDEPATNFFLSVAFRRNGELRRASLHRRIARSLLGTALHDDGLPFAEGLTARQLERMLRGPIH